MCCYDFWAAKEISLCYRAGIVGGYSDGTYQPGGVVTRAQMAVFVSRALARGDANVPAGPSTAHFPDVATDYWAYKYVSYANANSIVNGYTNGTYGPEIAVTRDQMAVFIARSIASPLGDAGLASYTPPTTPSFPDVAGELLGVQVRGVYQEQGDHGGVSGWGLSPRVSVYAGSDGGVRGAGVWVAVEGGVGGGVNTKAQRHEDTKAKGKRQEDGRAADRLSPGRAGLGRGAGGTPALPGCSRGGISNRWGSPLPRRRKRLLSSRQHGQRHVRVEDDGFAAGFGVGDGGLEAGESGAVGFVREEG